MYYYYYYYYATVKTVVLKHVFVVYYIRDFPIFLGWNSGSIKSKLFFLNICMTPKPGLLPIHKTQVVALGAKNANFPGDEIDTSWKDTIWQRVAQNRQTLEKNVEAFVQRRDKTAER